MNFLVSFFRGVALLPSIVQGLETLFGAKTGDEKKAAAMSIVQASINVLDAVTQKTIVDASAFTAGLSAVVDGVVACLNASVWHKA
jgi:hypothetical protein